MMEMDVNALSREIRIENATGHIEWLTKNTPNRISSGADVVKAAAYIDEYMDKLGLEVKGEWFYTYNSTPERSRLEVLEPVRAELSSLPCCHIRSTAGEGEVFDLVYLETEDYARLDELDVRGKMILVEMSYAPPVPEKARILHDAGAAGMVCMNWGNDEDVICNRALKAIWGNPTEETFPQIPNIVGLGVTRKSGLMLKELCMAGKPVKVRATAVADRQWQKVYQPWGVLHGNGCSEEFLLVSSHLDAWEPGVTCNATGNGLTLELCRVLSEHGAALDRDIWFTFWNGHEIAEAAGSTWFLDHHWSELNKRCISYTHIDSPGLKDATLFEIKASDELFGFAKKNAAKLVGGDLRAMELKKIGDQSFMGVGIPSVTQRMSYTKEYMDRNHGATLGWWNHTDEDGIDKYDPSVMKKDAELTLSLLYGLCTLKLLPYEFGGKFERLATILEDLRAKYGKRLDLEDLAANLQAAREAVARIEKRRGEIEGEESANLFNRFAIATSRNLTNVFQTYTGKYGQDSYGYGKLSSPLPLLADLGRLEKHDEASLEYGLIETELVRNRNRIDDALCAVIETTGLYERLL